MYKSNSCSGLGSPFTNTLSWESFDSRTTTTSAFLDIFGVQDSASIEPRGLPTELSLLLDTSGSHLDTEDTNSFLEPYVGPGTAALSSYDVLRFSSKATDEPINHGEPTYETFWTLPSLPQTQDLEKVVIDARFDCHGSGILGLSQGIDNPLETTFQSHFAPGNDGIPSTKLDSCSLNTMELNLRYNRNLRTGFNGHFLQNMDRISGGNGPPTTGLNDYSLDILRHMPANDGPSRRSPSDIVLASQLWNCLVCGMRFDTYSQLIAHASSKNHATLKCRVQPCGYVIVHKDQTYRNHLKTSHPNVYECQECNVSFASQPLLEDHARRFKHACFVCDNQTCENTFSRLDTYQRHQNKHRDDAIRFPCPHCKRYRGLNGFKRKDHLTQHLRGYHHIGEDDAQSQRGYSCSHEDFVDYRNESRNSNHYKNHAFDRRYGYINHMRTVHNESEFPCPSPACDRVGGKGYFRKADLRAHMKKVHGNDHAIIGATNP